MSDRKKAKIEENLWSSFSEIPSVPPINRVIQRNEGRTNEVDQNHSQRQEIKLKLSESLVAAVASGNVPFVQQVMETKQTRELLRFFQGFKENPDPFSDNPVKSINFGLHELIYLKGSAPLRKNLLHVAIQHNQLEMVQELVLRLGFDINASSRVGCENSKTHPLLMAIEFYRPSIIDFLLSQPNIIVTCPETRQYRKGNYRSRPRSEPTALSAAVHRESLKLIKQLIQKGAVEVSSTSRSDDPFSLVKTDPQEAEELIRLSVNEAIINAYNGIGLPGRKKQVNADILEVLLRETGFLVKNAITVYILDRIHNNCWPDIHGNGYNYYYNYNLGTDQDFDGETLPGAPSVRATSIARGTRLYLSDPNCLKGVPGLLPSTVYRIQEKHRQWTRFLKICQCQDRLAQAKPDWKKAPSTTAIVESFGWRRRRELLCWCELFVEYNNNNRKPWSQDRHHSSYPRYVRFYVRELLSLGSKVARRSPTSSHQDAAGALKELWDQKIIPLVVG